MHDNIKGCFAHFAKRLHERVGRNASPKRLWQSIITEMQRPDSPYLKFIARTNDTGRRVWRLDTGADPIFIVYDHEIDCPVTVLPRDGKIKVGRKRKTVFLENYR